ncbi:Ig-like domain-containing protein [Cronobacter sakazakii]|nr:Ig-like domain-containing protein [Cronobacter sakazakii]
MATYSVFTVTADKSALPSDGSLAATITAIIHDDTGAPAPDGTTVNWTVTAGGKLSAATSTTDASGAAIVEVTAIASGILTVTATTADDDTGKQTSIYASTALPAPTVSGATEADQYTLDYYDLQLGVQMVIPHYPNATAGDRITFWWGDYSHFTTLTDPSTQLPMVIDISLEIPPIYLEDGNYPVYYTAADAAGNTSYSSALPVVIANGGQTAPTLTKPVIPAGTDGYINIADAANGVSVEVSYPFMAAGDVITLYWPAVDSNNNPIMGASGSFSYTVSASDTSYTFIVSSALFFPNAGQGYQGSVDAYYTVLPAGASTVELSFDQSVNVDTVPPGFNA